jgi:hypothetical protein
VERFATSETTGNANFSEKSDPEGDRIGGGRELESFLDNDHIALAYHGLEPTIFPVSRCIYCAGKSTTTSALAEVAPCHAQSALRCHPGTSPPIALTKPGETQQASTHWCCAISERPTFRSTPEVFRSRESIPESYRCRWQYGGLPCSLEGVRTACPQDARVPIHCTPFPVFKLECSFIASAASWLGLSKTGRSRVATIRARKFGRPTSAIIHHREQA